MDELTSKEWDVIIVGTDCIQAVLAASLARAGKSVLHLDENAYYGGDMVSHSVSGMLEWAEEHKSATPQATVVEPWDAQVVEAEEPAASVPAADGVNGSTSDRVLLSARSKSQRTFSVSSVSCNEIAADLVAPFPLVVGERVVVYNPDPATGNPKPTPKPHRGWGKPPPPPPRPEFCRGILRELQRPSDGLAVVELDRVSPPAPSPSCDRNPPPACANMTIYVHQDQLAHVKDADPSLRTAAERAMADFKKVLDDDRRFVLDVKPRLLLSRGTAIEALIRSGVAKYMEFKLLEGTFVASNKQADTGRKGRRRTKPKKTGGDDSQPDSKAVPSANAADKGGGGSANGDGSGTVAGDSASGKRSPLSITAVPCSKADVFANKTLVLKDKLVLMKFLQFCLDFHVEDYEGVELSQQNEALPLGTGRSLKRPQNKRKANYDFKGHADGPFIKFLRDCVGLSDDLVTIAFHAIALASCDDAEDGASAAAQALVARVPAVTTRQGMQMISQYLGSLGRYGSAAYLCPMYGSCELPQAFCRYGAVHGAIYVLRRPVNGVVLDKLAPTADGAEGLPTRVVRGVMSDGLFFRSRTVICPPSYVPHLARVRPQASVARAMFIVRGAQLVKATTPSAEGNATASEADGEATKKRRPKKKAEVSNPPCGGLLAGGRSLCVLPPRIDGVANRCAVRVLQMDSSSMQVPRASAEEGEYFLVQMSTLALGQTQAEADAVLRRAFDALLQKRAKCDDVAVPPRLLWSMHYHERVFEADDETPSAAADVPQGLGVAFEGSMLFHIAAAQSAEEEAQREAQDQVTGSHRTGTGEVASMHYEAALLAAQRLFYKIAPGAVFFPQHDRNEDGSSGGDGVGGSSFDEGGDWDSVDVQGLAAAEATPGTGGGPTAGTA